MSVWRLTPDEFVVLERLLDRQTGEEIATDPPFGDVERFRRVLSRLWEARLVIQAKDGSGRRPLLPSSRGYAALRVEYRRRRQVDYQRELPL